MAGEKTILVITVDHKGCNNIWHLEADPAEFSNALNEYAGKGSTECALTASQVLQRIQFILGED